MLNPDLGCVEEVEPLMDLLPGKSQLHVFFSKKLPHIFIIWKDNQPLEGAKSDGFLYDVCQLILSEVQNWRTLSGSEKFLSRD